MGVRKDLKICLIEKVLENKFMVKLQRKNFNFNPNRYFRELRWGSGREWFRPQNPDPATNWFQPD